MSTAIKQIKARITDAHFYLRHGGKIVVIGHVKNHVDKTMQDGTDIMTSRVETISTTPEGDLLVETQNSFYLTEKILGWSV